MTSERPFRHPTHLLDRLDRTHRRVGIVPASDPSLRYVMAVPRGWGRASGVACGPTAGRSELLGLFSASADLEGPRVIVSVTRLRYDVDPLEWVRHHWAAAGWSIATAEWLEPRFAPRFEVGALRKIGTTVEMRRCTGFVDNGRLLRVDLAAPSRTWPQVHDLGWPCGVSMSLEQPTFRRRVEAGMRRCGPLLAFELPRSWCTRAARPPRAGAVRWVASPTEGEQGTMLLRIDASPWPGAGPRPVTERQLGVRHELWREGISMARHVQHCPLHPADRVHQVAGPFRTTARDHDASYELWLAHRDLDGVGIDYTAIVAEPQRCALDRMRTAAALEIALTTTELEPSEKHHDH